MVPSSDFESAAERRLARLIAQAREVLSRSSSEEVREGRLAALLAQGSDEEQTLLWEEVARSAPGLAEWMRKALGSLYPRAGKALVENAAATGEDFRRVAEYALSRVRDERARREPGAVESPMPDSLHLVADFVRAGRLAPKHAELELLREVAEGEDYRNREPALETLLLARYAEESWLLERLAEWGLDNGAARLVGMSENTPLPVLRSLLSHPVGSYTLYELLALNPRVREDGECYTLLRRAGVSVWEPALVNLARGAESERFREILQDLLEMPRGFRSLQQLLQQATAEQLGSLPREVRVRILSHPQAEVRLQGMRLLAMAEPFSSPAPRLGGRR